MTMIKVLLVDDHELVRAGVRRILEEAGDMQVVGEASDGGEALRVVRKLAPDVVLMDVNMPGMGGIEATRRLLRLMPGIKVIALTVLEGDPFPARLHEAGAVGFVTKGCPAREVIEAVRTANRGLPYVASAVARRHMLADWKGGATSPFEELSAREMQVAMMILNGQRTQGIADSLSLSPKTVSTYRQRIYDKLGVQTDVELTRLAYRYQLIVEQQDG
jgi:two-component system invasion response regulator UvrY